MFDPYHKWLGILPKDQPPNHYRLLSLELYESDLDVIEGAADRAMGFIRQYQSGEHAALAAKLLNQIATARLCLMKRASKAEYDEKLKKKLAVSQQLPKNLWTAGGIGATVCLLIFGLMMSSGPKSAINPTGLGEEEKTVTSNIKTVDDPELNGTHKSKIDNDEKRVAPAGIKSGLQAEAMSNNSPEVAKPVVVGKKAEKSESHTSFGSVKGTPLLAKQVHQILKTTCHRCHGRDGTVEGGINYVLDLKTLVSRTKVVPSDPTNSLLLQRVQSGEMPPADENPRPSEEDIGILKAWIREGAVDFALDTTPRAFIKTDDIFQFMRNDLQELNERDRSFTRYFTITHLYNAGISEDEMQTYRNGLSKLVNSLSWGRKIVLPKPIDPFKTIFRIDLRDFKWNEKTWEAIVAANPYGVVYNTPSATMCYEGTKTKVPIIRADWFVAAASHPPLYHQVLEMPSSDRELEQQLKVDVEADIRSERVSRAAFNGSGVSRNNRMIERHESSYGSYWKSYDFGSNSGKKNLFAFPLGPGHGVNDFDHDGGEIIFNLPNGLQAYLLVDSKGNRIEKGPTAIVSDARRPDKAVENGISCMSCHAKGMIEKNDQVRDHVQKNMAGFSTKEAETILALYPPKDKLAALIKDDAARFQNAVQETGDKVASTESIVALTLRFEAELDLRLAAAEIGLTPDQFKKELSRLPALARIFGILNVDGGTVQRDVFVADFGDIVAALKFGTFVPRTVAAVGDSHPKGEIFFLVGNSLDEWKTSPAGEKSHWSLNNGILRLDAIGPSLVTKENFRDFDLHLEFKLPPKCNSGVLLRGRYEVQLLDPAFRTTDGNPEPPNGQCGSIYGQIAPSKNMYQGPDRWNTLDIRLVGRVVTVRMNDVVIIDARTLSGVSGGALDQNESEPGPILLQAHRIPGQEFRNMRITSISDNDGGKPTNGSNVAFLQQAIIGKYEIAWTSDKGVKGVARYEFLPTNAVLKEGTRIGKWEVRGNTIQLTFSEEMRGFATITPLDQRRITAKHTWQNGTTATWDGKKLDDRATSGPTPSTDGEVSLFDGKTLSGWHGNKSLWSVKDGAIVGSYKSPLKTNSFLVTDRKYHNFKLSLKFQITDGNSGVQIRSFEKQNWVVIGPQADIALNDFKHLGSLTGEQIKPPIIAATSEETKQVLRNTVDPNGWNDMTVTADGQRVSIQVNGHTTVDVTSPSIPNEAGVIALQLHSGNAMTVRFKDIMLETLK